MSRRKRRKPPVESLVTTPGYADFVPERNTVPYVEPSPFMFSAPAPTGPYSYNDLYATVKTGIEHMLSGLQSSAEIPNWPKIPTAKYATACEVAYLRRPGGPRYCVHIDIAQLATRFISASYGVVPGETVLIHRGPTDGR